MLSSTRSATKLLPRVPTRLTDTALAHLAALPALRWLDVQWSPGISEAALAALRAARPALEVLSGAPPRRARCPSLWDRNTALQDR